MEMLLYRYGIDYKVIDEVGVFDNEKVQQLYDQLVAQGEESLVEAFKVGTLIEEVDIKDLNKAINETDNADIKLVFENLRNGSCHHLKAFVNVLEREGVVYIPQLLTEKEYGNIIKMSMGRYGKGKGKGKGYSKNTHTANDICHSMGMGNGIKGG